VCSNYVSFVEEDYGNLLDEAGRDQLGTIRRLVKRMNALLETLLEYSRVGRAELDIHPVPLGELVDEAVELVQSRVAERSAEVVNRCSGEVLCDRPLLRTVLMNLVSNALQYNDGDGPRIEIEILALTDTEQGPTLVDPVSTAVDPAGLPVVVAVSDDGIGIAEDRREEVFEVFRRFHPRDRYGGGTGAGLTVARRVVERHGGRMWIETSPLGGTAVLLTVHRP
jgi:signal transduction histidine kinase